MKQHVIQSSSNLTFKEVVRCIQSHARLKQAELAVAEGLHLFESLFIQNDRFSIHSIWLPEDLLAHPEFKCWMGLPQFQSVQSFVLPLTLYQKLGRLEHGTGPLVLFTQSVNENELPNLSNDVVLLDGVQDPGNVGAILRTCAAVGVTQIATTPDTAWVWADKVLRSGMGAHAGLRFFSEQSLLDAMTRLEAIQKYPVRATLLQNNASNLFETNLTQSGLWVFGNEGQGIRPVWQAKATQPIKIPQTAAVESLNVAVSSAVCLYEQFRQRNLPE